MLHIAQLDIFKWGCACGLQQSISWSTTRKHIMQNTGLKIERKKKKKKKKKKNGSKNRDFDCSRLWHDNRDCVIDRLSMPTLVQSVNHHSKLKPEVTLMVFCSYYWFWNSLFPVKDDGPHVMFSCNWRVYLLIESKHLQINLFPVIHNTMAPRRVNKKTGVI